jgi:hypothetical protein
MAQYTSNGKVNMNWGKLIADNFDKVLVLVSTLLGGVLGGGITYFVQSRLQERQRRWALDDQRRQWRRDQLFELSSVLENVTTSTLRASINPEGKVSPEDFPLWAELAAKADYHVDDQINELFRSLIVAINNQSDAVRSGDEKRIAGNSAELRSALTALRRRFDQLIEETYSPPPSLLQRILKRLTPKHSKETNIMGGEHEYTKER